MCNLLYRGADLIMYKDLSIQTERGHDQSAVRTPLWVLSKPRVGASMLYVQHALTTSETSTTCTCTEVSWQSPFELCGFLHTICTGTASSCSTLFLQHQSVKYITRTLHVRQLQGSEGIDCPIGATAVPLSRCTHSESCPLGFSQLCVSMATDR